MPETIHCSLCGKPIKVENVQDMMVKIRHHRKKYHPKAFRESIRKGVKSRKAKGKKVKHRK